METLELEIIDVSRAGSGVGKLLDGRVAFVPFTLTGDIVKARTIKNKKNYILAEVVSFIKYSPNRVTPRCSYFIKCGGCQMQHIPYQMQWEIKTKGVYFGLKQFKVIEPNVSWNELKADEYPAKKIWNYRNRIQLKGEEGELGFYQKSTHKIVDINRCEIVHESINKEISKFKNRAKSLGSKKDYKIELEYFEGEPVKSSYNKPHAALGFRQINDEQNQNLMEWLKKNLVGNNILIDLYGGSGNLSLPLSHKFQEIYCVDTAQNIKNRDKSLNIQFIQSDSLRWVLENQKKFLKKEVSILIDPPRDGLGKSAQNLISSFREWNVKELILIGCELDPWLRDVLEFKSESYELKKLAVFDFFPHTRHIESLAYMARLF